MDPLTIIGATSASIQLIKQLLPLIDQLAASGEVSAEDQQKVRDEFNALRVQGNSVFEQPHWKL